MFTGHGYLSILFYTFGYYRPCRAGKNAGMTGWKSTTSFALGRRSFLHGLLVGVGFTGAGDGMIPGVFIVKHFCWSCFLIGTGKK